jgi:GNAT superfamily N-acetyltransferase
MKSINLRRATKADQATLVEFNRAMALETEHKVLDPEVLSCGVAAVFDDAAKGFYLVAELDGTVAGQLMITTEWSDWRNGWFWWIQSVDVSPKARQQGIFRQLYHEVERMAKVKGDIVGLRLYVERDNVPAQRTYLSLGMKDAGYLLFESSIRG